MYRELDVQLRSELLLHRKSFTVEEIAKKNSSPPTHPHKKDHSQPSGPGIMFECNCLAVSVVCDSINTAEGHEHTISSDADANINQYVFCW